MFLKFDLLKVQLVQNSKMYALTGNFVTNRTLSSETQTELNSSNA